MNVKQLIEVLEKLEDKENIDVYFSYDSRCCCPPVNCVDLVNDGEAQDQRINASMFLKGYEEPPGKKSIVFRSEDKIQHEYYSPTLSEEEFREKTTKEEWDENKEWSAAWYYKKYGNPNTNMPATTEQLKELVENKIEERIETFLSHKEETKGDINLFFEEK